MPTYRVTGPDGATYDVTPPEGTNPSQEEILAQVQQQAGAATTGNAITRGWQDYVVDPLKGAINQLPGLNPQQRQAKLTDPQGLGEMVTTPISTPSNALVTAGTLAAGPLGWLGRL